MQHTVSKKMKKYKKMMKKMYVCIYIYKFHKYYTKNPVYILPINSLDFELN